MKKRNLLNLFFLVILLVSSSTVFFTGCEDEDCDIGDIFCEEEEDCGPGGLPCEEDEEEEEEEECDPQPEDCETISPDDGLVTISVTAKEAYTPLEVTIYRGEVEDDNVADVIIVGTGEHLIRRRLPPGNYSAVCDYTYKGKVVRAIDGDELKVDYESYCEGHCYFTTGGDIDLKFNENAFREYIEGDEAKCFIATATYGSPIAKEVMVLRNFRDKYMMQSVQGKLLVELYYKYSPPFAEMIKKSPFLKRVSIAVLTPIVYMVKNLAFIGYLFIAILLITIMVIKKYTGANLKE